MEDKSSQEIGSSSVLKYSIRYLTLLVVLGLAVHLILPQRVSLEHSYQVIQSMIIWAVIFALVAEFMSYLSSGYILKAIVRLSGGAFSLFKGTIIVLAAYSLGMVAGGLIGIAAATYRWMSKEGVAPQTAGFAGTLPGFLNSCVLFLVSLAGLVYLLVVHELSRIQAISYLFVFLLLGALASLLVWGMGHRPWMKEFADRIVKKWSKLRHVPYRPETTKFFLNELFNDWDSLLVGGWRGPLLGAILSVAFDMLTLYFLFIAANYPISPDKLLTGYGLPLLLGKMAFFIPGGIGVVESTMTSLYISLGVPSSVAVVVVLSYRLISFWLPLLLGFPLILTLENHKVEKTIQPTAEMIGDCSEED